MEDFEKLEYLAGFNSEFQSEDKRTPRALPVGQNNPQKCPYGLYAEQINGSAFTASRDNNFRSWLYRLLPSAKHSKYIPAKSEISHNWAEEYPDPNQKRWNAFQFPTEPTDFLEGMKTVCGAGDPKGRSGIAIHVFTCNRSMVNSAFQSADGEMLIVAQSGALKIKTEMGRLMVIPGEICVIPQGIRFAVEVDGDTRGYILEVFGTRFKLPDLGPIGANGLANARDFMYPTAWFEEKDEGFTIYNKYQGAMFSCVQGHSCFNVCAWHGNYAPYKYELWRFVTVNSVSFDHMDPSIFTVLTAPSLQPGVAVADFVIFPPRWSVHEHTFRPPYYHRNCMSEFMGLICGKYEAKEKGFCPGGATLHSIMTPHGPDGECFDKASNSELKPQYIGKGQLAFMFESCFMLAITKFGQKSCNVVDEDYYKCWQGITKKFNGDIQLDDVSEEFYKKMCF